MIRLYLNGYSEEDISVMIELFEEMLTMFLTTYCKDNCINCTRSKICRDIEKAIDHLAYEYESR